jgi:heavy metal translocating P-type ATPase
MKNNNVKHSIIPLIIYGIFMLIYFYIILISNIQINIQNIIIITKNSLNYYILLSIIPLFFLIYARDIISNGLINLKNKDSSLDTLLTIIIIFIYLTSLIEVILYSKNAIKSPNVYYEVIILIILFRKISNYINYKTKNKLSNNIKEVVSTLPINIRLKEDIITNKNKIKVGDILISTPGTRIIYDGVIVKGKAHFNESFISGESNPIEKGINTKIFAGSINCDSTIEYQVESINNNYYKNKEKEDTKSIINKLSKIVLIYIIIMFIVSIIVSYFINNNTTYYIKLINIIIITCPYSLILISSIKENITINQALKKKIILKNPNSIEKISKIDTVVLDKTGILTRGEYSISKINNHSRLDEKSLLELLGSIEKNSTHPIARGITSYLKEEKIKTNYDFQTEDLLGYGVKAKDEENIYYACSSLLLKKLDIINSYEEEERKMLIDGNSVIYLVKNNKVIATFGIKDTLRKEAKSLINSLKKKNLDVIILTGDNEIVTNKIIEDLNVDKVIAGVNPKEKEKYLSKLIKENKKVLMIGDGENDRDSLNIATISVTIKGVSETVTNEADIILLSKNLLKILDIFNLGIKTNKYLKLNIILYILFSILFIPIALDLVPSIKLNTILIIIYLIISIMCVIINILLLKRDK